MRRTKKNMPRRHHPGTLAVRIDRLMVDVFFAGEGEIPRLAERLATDFVHLDPNAGFEGAQGLSDAYSRFRHDE